MFCIDPPDATHRTVEHAATCEASQVRSLVSSARLWLCWRAMVYEISRSKCGPRPSRAPARLWRHRWLSGDPLRLRWASRGAAVRPRDERGDRGPVCAPHDTRSSTTQTQTMFSRAHLHARAGAPFRRWAGGTMRFFNIAQRTPSFFNNIFDCAALRWRNLRQVHQARVTMSCEMS